jgi:tRNA nucleotidyltransferase (CCA-adding enzyme)
MSDYMFMLDNHLNAEQKGVLAEMQACAAELNLSLFLTGGAMRDMLGGFPIRDLDFTVEGPALKLAKLMAQRTHAEIISTDDTRKSAELRYPGGVTVGVAMARQERYTKPGGRPHVQPATIHEDLRGRDFTINAIALSLNRASRGLLLDPTNGLADIELRELRTCSNYTLYDDPARMLRLLRFKVRLGYTIADRTLSQYRNAREAGLESRIPVEALTHELRNIAAEPNAGEVLQELEREKLIGLFSTALEGPKLNLAGFAKLSKARQLVPFGIDFPVNDLALFFFLVTEKLNPKERTALVKLAGLSRTEIGVWQKLEPNAKALEKKLKSPSLQRPSALYGVLSKVPGEQVLFLLMKSGERLVQDRIKHYLQKYLPAAEEVTDREVALEKGIEPGSPKFEKARQEMITRKLDSRPKKAPIEATPAPAPAMANPARGARG